MHRSLDAALERSKALPTAEKDAPTETVVTEWAVDTGYAVARVESEAMALRWVQSYLNHPEALDQGEQMPFAVSRTVTTSAWTRVTPPGSGDRS